LIQAVAAGDEEQQPDQELEMDEQVPESDDPNKRGVIQWWRTHTWCTNVKNEEAHYDGIVDPTISVKTVKDRRSSSGHSTSVRTHRAAKPQMTERRHIVDNRQQRQLL
jgi:hypothetical protein